MENKSKLIVDFEQDLAKVFEKYQRQNPHLIKTVHSFLEIGLANTRGFYAHTVGMYLENAVSKVTQDTNDFLLV